jgi:hypothetical protein
MPGDALVDDSSRLQAGPTPSATPDKPPGAAVFIVRDKSQGACWFAVYCLIVWTGLVVVILLLSPGSPLRRKPASPAQEENEE